MGTWQDAIQREPAEFSPATKVRCRNHDNGGLAMSQNRPPADRGEIRPSAPKLPIMSWMHHSTGLLLVALLMSAPLTAQTPQPFPRPGATQPPPKPAQPSSPPTTQPPPATSNQAPPPAARPAQPPTTKEVSAPSTIEVYFPVYPAAQFLAVYDAGRSQRYSIYGATAPFAEVVTFYRSQLDEKGSLIFKEPPTHMFEVGRYKEETMAFPPGVTVKDWTWGGSKGYVNPKPKGQPERFPTIIMIVPPLPGGGK